MTVDTNTIHITHDEKAMHYVDLGQVVMGKLNIWKCDVCGAVVQNDLRNPISSQLTIEEVTQGAGGGGRYGKGGGGGGGYYGS